MVEPRLRRRAPDQRSEHWGPGVPQAIAVSFAGYFFYLIRRASGGNILNSVLHGMFDFSILTGTAIFIDQQGYAGSLFAILAYVVIAIVVIARRKHIEPAATTTA